MYSLCTEVMVSTEFNNPSAEDTMFDISVETVPSI